MFDYIVIGVGFSGSVIAERIATQMNRKVLVIDKRNHIGGNAHDYYDENGVLIHKYGPHIFHTNSREVINYLSQFTEWRPYEHRVLAVVKGKKIPVPFNLNSIDLSFAPSISQKLQRTLISIFGYGAKIPILKLRENRSSTLKALADYIYENIFYGYTIKQWGMKPEELDKSVTGRVPIYVSHDNRYFQDTYQFMPRDGYTKMFERMLAHKNITIKLNTCYADLIDEIKGKKIIFTGPIDEYFDYCLGKLPYRSLSFNFKTLTEEFHQDVGTVNYPNSEEFTRITEMKHLTGQNCESTTICYEYPKQFVNIHDDERYYPIPKANNNELYRKYFNMIGNLNNIYFCGRLADYKYYNMDQVVARAITIFEREIAK